MSFTFAAAQYPIDRFENFEGYVRKVRGWVDYAARRGAKLAVFPEYGAMELASLNAEKMGDLEASLHFVAQLAPHVDALHIELAREHDLYILASTIPAERGGRFRNTARLFAPSGAMAVQEKMVMTRFEREQWDIAAGERLTLFDTDLGRLGVLTCYDAEFPLLGRMLVEAGAEVILVPSCTDTLAGFNRVRIGARARALEGQCYAVHSCTVGEAPWSPAVDENHGFAAIYGPPDIEFPESGVVASGRLDQPEWVFGEIDLDKVAKVRSEGAVFNMRHWDEQPGAGRLPEVEIIPL